MPPRTSSLPAAVFLGFLVGVILTCTVWSMWEDVRAEDGGNTGSALWTPTKGIRLKNVTKVPSSQPPTDDAAIPVVDKTKWPISFMHTPDTFVDIFKSCEEDMVSVVRLLTRKCPLRLLAPRPLLTTACFLMDRIAKSFFITCKSFAELPLVDPKHASLCLYWHLSFSPCS